MNQLTDAERAKYHLNRRRGTFRAKADPQAEGLFAEPEPQIRQWVPLGQDDGLFTEPAARSRRLVAIDGWPDYRHDGGDHAP
jgi:hypothetical protein